MPFARSYHAYAVSLSNGTVTVTSGSSLTSTGFSITDTTPGGADNGMLGSASGVTSTFSTSLSVGGNTAFSYLGTVTINGITGFLASNGNGGVELFTLSSYQPPLSGATGTLMPANPASTTQDTQWSIPAGSPVAACFTEGTRIATVAGDVAVEDLKVGDLVLTQSGAAVPVRWVGRSVTSRVFADPVRLLPIEIKAGALGENLPSRDLSVSPGHALVLDGVLVQAGALVNGTSIVRDTLAPVVFTYFHVMLDRHDVIFAEGVPTESYLDGVEDLRFDNAAERPEMVEPMAEMDLPRVKAARQVPQALRERIAARVAVVAADVAAAA